jgi:ABC-type glutathione transport system ATPase component
MTDALLAVTDLRKVFPRGRGHKGDPIVAVDGVSLTVPAEGSVAIVGESGSGKTTLGRMIGGLEVPTAGTIAFDGRVREQSPKRAERLALARQVQMVFQDPYGSLDPRQTGRQCLDESLRVHSTRTGSQRQERIAELAEQVGLAVGTFDAPPHRLSGGQRQRLAIARALAVEPRLIVLDEAVSALDVSVQAQVLNLLAAIRRETGVAYVFISHDLAVVRQVSEDVLVMRAGRVVEQGRTADVLAHPRHPYTKLLRDSVPRAGWSPNRHVDEQQAP